MSKRVVLALAVLLAAGSAAFAGAAPASAVVCLCGTVHPGQSAPLSPDDAAAAAATPGAGHVSAATAVDSATVLAAISAPGAETEIESGLTAEQAVGLGDLPDVTSTRSKCWRDQAWWQWGTWPYQQKITDTTYWCARYGMKITLRSTSVSAGGMLCGVAWRTAQLVGGGIGFASFTERSSAGFSCPTVVPWITLHTTHHLDVRRDDRGRASILGTG